MVVYLVFYLLTGLGIIYWRQIEPLTLGLLGKAQANQIHDNLHFPFIALLLAHTCLSLFMKEE